MVVLHAFGYFVIAYSLVSVTFVSSRDPVFSIGASVGRACALTATAQHSRLPPRGRWPSRSKTGDSLRGVHPPFCSV